eukprot:CAMPEP_0185797996 /NCGR_PEP_ID=MMETSP1174-20130828/161912_1 /TAXON_ID=35687 /ORGANISM="Dictyocha speculum, Strain CCMP1381" /LENGTH=66 /DNA_ID=CAMNT_0028493461 /DNA_START=338 /DNA_END=538 /DNA_ORIENTATION=+
MLRRRMGGDLLESLGPERIGLFPLVRIPIHDSKGKEYDRALRHGLARFFEDAILCCSPVHEGDDRI